MVRARLHEKDTDQAYLVACSNVNEISFNAVDLPIFQCRSTNGVGVCVCV